MIVVRLILMRLVTEENQRLFKINTKLSYKIIHKKLLELK